MCPRNPRFVVLPFLLMLALGLLIACATAAAPTAVPPTPAGPASTDTPMMDDPMEKEGGVIMDGSMEKEGDATIDGSMEKEGDAMMDGSMEKRLVGGWYRDRAVEYYDFGANSAVDGSMVGTAPIYVFIHGLNPDGSPQFVEGQHNVVDVVPGEEGYSDLWQVMLVTVPEGYEPDSITSKEQLDAAGYEIAATDMLVNCPIVPQGTTLEGGEELVQGWHDGEQVFYPDFGQNIPAAIPIWVYITGMDEQGNPQFVEGQNNIIDAVPGDPGYSAFWRVNLVTVPEGYEPNSIRSAAEVQAAGFTITVTDMVVNCPVIFVAES
ncbi:MAG TPA: hypothetical protein VFA32_11635 [Dehalococcoidia bacterium]|nr:hypothetical protein [Dehalococcoidia bacterium]